MTTASKRKGDAHERNVVDYLRSKLGQHVARLLAGAEDDRGDISGVPGFTLELKSYKDIATGLRNGMADLAIEQRNAGTRWGAVILKRPRVAAAEKQYVVMELDQFVDLLGELPANKHNLRRVDL